MIQQVILGDCLIEMQKIPDKTIDLILTDLPYGTTTCKWDSIINFNQLWLEYKRIIKEKGSVILFATQPFQTKLISSSSIKFKYELIWIKNQPTGIGRANKQPMRYHENICIFCNSETIYNKQMSERWSEKAKSVVTKGVQGGHHTVENKQLSSKVPQRRFYNSETVNPKTVLYFDCVPNGGGRKLHPTQKPVSLCEYLIKSYTNENDLVLDNCAGSGTTGIACKNLNRQFILIEKEEKYYNIILERLFKT